MSTAHPRPVVTLLTDFGTSDHYVAAMKGIILGICPQVQMVDITHEVSPYAIAEAGFTLFQAWSCFPAGTIHLVVVDPGVGSERRPLVVEAAGHQFAGPDNGVFSMVYDAVPAHRVREISASRYFREPVSNTFHGRDIFAPVAAQLALGLAPEELGMALRDYCRLKFAKPVCLNQNLWEGSILKVDHFGNLITNFDSAAWQRLVSGNFAMKAGNSSVRRILSNYRQGPQDELFLIRGSVGYLEISLNQGDAAKATGLQSGDPISLTLLEG